MAVTTEVNGVEYWEDASGRLVPRSDVEQEIVLRDEMVQAIVDEAKQLQGEIVDFKSMVYDAVQNYMNQLRDKYNKTPSGKRGKPHKGNLTFRDFSGKFKVVIAVNDTLSFDEKITLAKELIDQCLVRWSNGANKNLISIVNDAFDVDKVGKINVKKILSLRKIKAEDQEWVEAMRLINESIEIEMSKKYIRIYERTSDGEGWDRVSLGLS